MNSRWPKHLVRDLLSAGILYINDGYRMRRTQLDSSGIPFVRGGDIRDGWIDTDIADHIAEQHRNALTAKLSKPWDVAFITKGTVGRVGLLRPEQPQVVFAPQVCFWRSLDSSQLDSKFLFYLLKSSFFQNNLNAVKTHGSMVADYVSLRDQRLFRLPFPPVADQLRITCLLGALDDKIELNRAMNRTLEEMAQAIFKSWFIDFDGHTDLVPSELGPIPRGWRCGVLGDAMELKRGYDLPKRLREDGQVPIVSSSGTSGVHSTAKVTGPGIVTGRYGTIGKVYYVEEDFWPLNTTLYVRDFKGNEFWYLFYLLGTVNFGSYLDKAAVPGVNRNHLHLEKVVLPTVDWQRRFSETAQPLWAKHSMNHAESETLAELRDTLLPRLISGELRIPEAEMAVERAL